MYRLDLGRFEGRTALLSQTLAEEPGSHSLAWQEKVPICIFLSGPQTSLSLEDYKQLCLQYLPPLQECLKDKNAQVVVGVLKVMSMMKTIAYTTLDLGDLESVTDDFYRNNIVRHNVSQIVSLLHSRRFRASKEIRMWVLTVLGETEHLRDHIDTFNQMLNSDQISTLVEFAESFHLLGPLVLQYVPLIIAYVKPGTPLVRHLVKLLQKAARTMSTDVCDKLFSVHTILQMLKHRDPYARRIATVLLGLKCEIASRNNWLLFQMWQDKNGKVKKTVMDTIGNLGKHSPSTVSLIMESSFMDDANSLMVWRNLSLAWGVLINDRRDAGVGGQWE